MDRLQHHARVFFTALFISQVCGFPTFFWSQPDCNQQPVDDSYNAYGGFQGYNYQPPNTYQGPSYQDTLRGMVDDTVTAVNDIVRVTVTAVKQELIELSKILYDNFQRKNCNSAEDDGDSSDYNGMNEIVDYPVQIINFPGQSMGTQYTNPPVHQNEIPNNVETRPLLEPQNKTCTNSEGSDLEDKIGHDQTNVSIQPSSNHVSNNTNVMYVHVPSSSSEKTTEVPLSNISKDPSHDGSTKVDFSSSNASSIHGENNVSSANSSTESMSTVNLTSVDLMTTKKPEPIGNKLDMKTNTTSLASTTNKLTTTNTSSVSPTTESINATPAITIDHQSTSKVLHNATGVHTTEESTKSTDEFTFGVDQVTSVDFTTDGSFTLDLTDTSTFPIDFDIVTTMPTPVNSSSFTTEPSAERKTQFVLNMNNTSQMMASNVSALPGSLQTSTMANNVNSTESAASNVTTKGSTSEMTNNINGVKPNEDQQFTPRLDSLSTESTTKATRNPKL